MSVELRVIGVEDTEQFIEDWARLVSSDELWIATTTAAVQELQRFAVSISPVVTGSYRGAHKVFSESKQAILTIDSSAFNPISRRRVIDYAGVVEERHNIYGQTFNQMSERAAIRGVEIVEDKLR